MKAGLKTIDLNDAIDFDQYWPDDEKILGYG